MEKLKEALFFLAIVISAAMILDFAGFLLWQIMGQTPADNFYLGTITTHIIQAIIY